MQFNVRRLGAWLGAICLCVGMGAFTRAAEPAVSDADSVPGVWQHHALKINYFGFTAHFTCYGLEDHVRDILLHLGARKDAKVSATGCVRGPDAPSPSAWVSLDFYTLAPAPDNSNSADVVKAYWAPKEIGPRRPFFMGDGDCELVEQLKDTISKSFSLRDVEYRTDCVPNQITLDGFRIKALALIAVPAPKKAANLSSLGVNG